MSSKVELRSSDGHMFEVDEAVAFESQTVKNMIEDTGKDSAVPLPNVTSKILAKVIEYCKYHVDLHKSGDEQAIPEEDVKAWDADFVKVDQATLFDLILGAMSPIVHNCIGPGSKEFQQVVEDWPLFTYH